jgi:hypothetical protein
MKYPSLEFIWRIAEAESAHAGFSKIGVAHFWVGICKAVDGVRQKTSRSKTQEKRENISLAIAEEDETAVARKPSILKKISIRKPITIYDC